MFTEGPAKDHQGSALTPYEFHQKGFGEKPIYRNSDDIYLYYYSSNSSSNWQVRKYKNYVVFIDIKWNTH